MGRWGPLRQTVAMIMRRTQRAFHGTQGHLGSLPQGEITSSQIAPKGKFQMFASHQRKAAPMARADQGEAAHGWQRKKGVAGQQTTSAPYAPLVGADHLEVRLRRREEPCKMRQEQRMVVAEREVNSSAECATVFRRWAFQWVLQRL